MGVVCIAANPKGSAGGRQPRAYMPSGYLRPQLSSPSQARGPKPPYSKKYQKDFVEHWSANYQDLAVTKDAQLRASTTRQTLNGIFRHHRQSIRPSRVNTAAINEAEQYLQTAVIGEESEILVLQLWKRVELSYPSLASMARDILVIPGMLVFISVTLKHYSQS